jgi:hypothetical protein
MGFSLTIHENRLNDQEARIKALESENANLCRLVKRLLDPPDVVGRTNENRTPKGVKGRDDDG